VKLLVSLFFLGLLPPSPVLAKDPDAPRQVWFTQDFDLDNIRLEAAVERIGEGIHWDTGDTIYGQENWAYQQVLDDGQTAYLVLYEGELGIGYRITTCLPSAANLGFSSGTRKTSLEWLKVRFPPYPVIKVPFHPAIKLGTSMQEVLKLIGQKGKIWTENGLEMHSYSWEANKPFQSSKDIWNVQTSLTVGFLKGALQYFDVNRFWQD
jgi:hypothetical protein